MKEAYKKIQDLLNQIAIVSFGETIDKVVIEDYADINQWIKKYPNLDIWKYLVKYPNGQNKEYFLILPDKNLLSFDNIDLPGEYYIIDCFGNFRNDKNVISPNSLLSNFLLNVEGYYTYLNTIPVYNDISKLYTERTISFYNNEEKELFNLYENESFEILLEHWKFKGKRPLLILGERGIGKTWAVQNFCLTNALKYNKDPWNNPLPLYLNLRYLSEKISGITDVRELIFFHLREKYDIKIFGNYFTFLALVNTGKLLLVLDGLDEMSVEISKEITLKNLWQIFTLFSSNSKFILTSRINFFYSRDQLNEHFAYQKYIEKKIKQNFSESLYKREEKRIRQNFNIWEIQPFTNEARFKLLKKAYSISDDQLDEGLNKLLKLEKFSEGTIEYEIFKLWETPGYFLPLLRLLASNNNISQYELFENCINSVIIEYNIETDRAINKYKTISSDEIEKNRTIIKGHIFGAEQKNAILRKLAWYMIERNLIEFSMVDFPDFIKEIDGEDYDIVLNDLQTQTVITIKDDGKYGFISDSIFAFYIANYIILTLNKNNPIQIEQGLRCIGRYDFLSNKILFKACIFLKSKFKDLFFNSETINFKSLLQNITYNILLIDRPYSIWQRYLTNNLNLLDIKLDKKIINERDFWVDKPISNDRNETDKSMVLIVNSTNNLAFFLGVTEVTNREFNEFLYSDAYEETSQYEECLGKWWRKSETKNPENPYKGIINYYHLIFWSMKTIIPVGKNDHPVVWISWFAAAKYCNWLSRKENIDPYYKFLFNENGEFLELILKRESSGYRLPTRSEWIYAAKDGRTDITSFLDIFQTEEEKQKARNKFMKPLFDTFPVKNENANNLGIYGIIGNVREWVEDETGSDIINKFTQQMIKGVAWLSDDTSFNFENFNLLLAQNNNADVGFRIARNLSPEERKRVNEANKIYEKSVSVL